MQSTDHPISASTVASHLQVHVAELGRASPAAGGRESPHGEIETAVVESYFDSHTIVTLDRNGQPLSRYADSSWNISSMSTDGGLTPCNLYFFEPQPQSVPPEISRPHLTALVSEQQRALMWLYMDAGRQRAQSTTLSANQALRQIARGAYRRGVTLFELFCDPQLLAEESANLNSNYAKCLRSLLKTLWLHRNFLKVGMEVRLKQLREVINQCAPDGDDDGNQTPLIPSRIYCAILAQLIPESVIKLQPEYAKSLI